MLNRLRNWQQTRFERWVSRRIPASKEIRLNRTNTFIFPTGFGFGYLGCCLVLFLLGTNYQNNLILFLVFFLISLFIACLMATHQNMSGLKLTAMPAENQFKGKVVSFPLKLHKKEGIRGIELKFMKHQNQLAQTCFDELACVSAVANARGNFNPGRLTVSSRFPLGLFNCWTHLDMDWQVVIYPKPAESRKKPVNRESDKEDQGSFISEPGFDEFTGLRQYQPGESLKSVAWKQVAQGRGWFSKVFEQARGGESWLDLAQFYSGDLEASLGELTYLTLELTKKKVVFGLTLGSESVPPGVGEAHKNICLQTLALYRAR